MKTKITSLIVSIVALVSASIALCSGYPRVLECRIDYQGIYVAIFSAIVTLLIGWNIYSLLDIRTEWNAMRNGFENLRSESERKSKYGVELSKAYANYLEAEGALAKDKYILAYNIYLHALCIFHQIGEVEMVEKMKERIGVVIRKFRADKKQCVRDYDLYNDYLYTQSCAYIMSSIVDTKVVELVAIMEHLIETIPITACFGGFSCKVFSTGIEIKKRANALYILIYNDGKKLTHKGKVFNIHLDFEEEILKDLEESYDYLAICESLYEINQEVLDKIKAVDSCTMDGHLYQSIACRAF